MRSDRWVHRVAPQSRLDTVDAALSVIEDIELILGCLSLFLIMLVQSINVTLRYAFNAPLDWSYGLTAHYLLLGAFFLALPYTYRVGGHVRVDIVVSKCSKRYRTILTGIESLITLFLFAFLAYEGTLLTIEAWTTTELMSDFYNFYAWTSNILVPMGVILLDLRVLLKLIQLVTGASYSPRGTPFFIKANGT